MTTTPDTAERFANMAHNYQESKEAGVPAHEITPDATPRKRGRPAKWNGDIAARQKDYRNRLDLKTLGLTLEDMPRTALVKLLVRNFVRLDKGDVRNVHYVNAILAELLRRANLLAAASKSIP